MTSLAEEQEAQQVWTQRQTDRADTYFSQLVDHEFIPPDHHRAWQDQQLRRLIGFAAAQSPYYEALFQQLAMAPDEIACVDDLPRLPILAMDELVNQPEALNARSLPPGQRIFGTFSSSGTTGRPKRVLMTASASKMFTYMVQRQARWARFDPGGTVASIRDADALPRNADGSLLAVGQTSTSPQWRFLGHFFQTGPSMAYSYANPTSEQVRWLRQSRPSYLISYPTALEELGRACAGGPGIDGLRGLQSISGELREPMRRGIEAAFGVPVQQDYGLNEVGLVASRCEADRYHVHTEHCVVEIVDEQSRPCAAGQIGRVLVTNLSNLATPLIRYDTDDMAEVTEGPCPCGRTSPTFGRIFGRYRRWSALPEGTRERFYALGEIGAEIPEEVFPDVSRYQVHQDERGDFELRLLMNGDPLPAYEAELIGRWRERFGDGPALRVRKVDAIPVGQGGKPQEFTSALEAH